MKKLISLMLISALCLSMCSCSSTASAEATQSQEATVSETTEPEIVVYNPGEKVSTDLAEFTLERSQFTYYISGKTADYMEPRDDGGFWAASIGYCYVHLVFTITSKDRGNTINFAGEKYETEWNPKFTLFYDGNEYKVNAYNKTDNKGQDYFDMRFSNVQIYDLNTGEKKPPPMRSEYPLHAGETVTLITFGVVNLDPENLTDGYDLSVQVPNSSGEYEIFTYRIPARH